MIPSDFTQNVVYHRHSSSALLYNLFGVKVAAAILRFDLVFVNDAGDGGLDSGDQPFGFDEPESVSGHNKKR